MNDGTAESNHNDGKNLSHASTPRHAPQNQWANNLTESLPSESGSGHRGAFIRDKRCDRGMTKIRHQLKY
jgi:hypothetical protein